MNPGGESFNGIFSINAESFNTDNSRVISGIDEKIEVGSKVQEFEIDYQFWR